ncbi:hypothetical protein ATE47_02100 [Chryseobacterium sp. IHB B 17019]|uniref:hypothetical protein n=1 Tax=Chryseobacterium sp. IHB B 17019 TaxID=1721091 RepID=UPI00071F38B7|nr:hypothetical protein [Chryseobacterium sp. IHB B 17019]ALR29398.1 hypothetical protein ATE47_02100 [Chryseobacterium sp. IHB B 17019]
MVKKILFILAFAGIIIAHAQTGNIGIDTALPTTKLDINGGITYREGAPITVSGTTVVIPNLSFSQYRLTGTPSSTFTITGPTTSGGTTAIIAGARLTIVNATSQSGVLNSFSVLPGLAQEFTYSNGSWTAIRNPSGPIGLFARSAGTQVFSGAQVINDWVATTNNFGAAWNGSVFTVPVGMQGWYNISAGYSTNANYATGGIRTPFKHVVILVNSSTVAQASAAVVVDGTVNGFQPGSGTANASVNYYLNAGDQVSIIGNHSSFLHSNNTSTPAPSEPILTYLSVLKQ